MTFRKYRIGELGKVVTGKTPSTKRPDYWGGEFPFITIPDLNNLPYVEQTERTLSQLGAMAIKGQILPENSVLMSCIATVGKCGLTTRPSITNQQINAVIPNDKVDPLFLLYLFRNLGAEMARYGGGGTVYSNISKSLFESIEVEIPESLLAQSAISKILASLDAKIASNNLLSRILEDIAQTIFKSWFIDFDPVKAKMASEKPEGMDAATASLFPDSMENSEVGLIPEGWNISKLRNHIEVTKGKSYKSSELEQSDIALVTLKSFKRGGGYRFDGLKPFSGEFKPEQIVEPGELIVSFTDVTQAADVIGKPAIVFKNPSFSRLVASLDVGIVRPLGNEVGKHYLYQLFSTLGFKNHIDGYTNGTTVLHLGKGALEDFTVALPGSKIMSKYEMFASTALGQSQALYLENLTLEAIRDSLLPRLISGDLQIPEEMLAS